VRCLISNEPSVTKTLLSQSIRSLTTNIQSNGLLNPILLYANKVIYGMQRSVIARYLNYDFISCYYCESEDQVERIHKEQIKNDIISL
jgi:ParB-like chromosome segregation protein Spo0J|tara:strand:+ start:240 stop:503 length:264 start_codon:yes stop_codon:yes gene_type:complete